jgi:hypothetical protein
VIGGPQGDCGLTGRKIIVDTYGGACPHGGGAFSGKDPTKVDRSAAYAARYVAKNIVAAGLARQCQIQVAYAIGVARPMNVTVYTEGTGVIPDEQIAALVNEHFDLRPKGIIQMLDLLRPIYSKQLLTATSVAKSRNSAGNAPTKQRFCALQQDCNTRSQHPDATSFRSSMHAGIVHRADALYGGCHRHRRSSALSASEHWCKTITPQLPAVSEQDCLRLYLAPSGAYSVRRIPLMTRFSAPNPAIRKPCVFCCSAAFTAMNRLPPQLRLNGWKSCCGMAPVNFSGKWRRL